MVAAQQQKSRKQWQRNVLKNLWSLQSDSSPDCCILLGTERIPVHKTALQLNSSLLTSGDVSYNRQSDLIEIELLPEFSEYFHLVSEIVKSFYTGDLHVDDENMKTVYKFAKCYGVQWLLEYVRPMFKDHIKKDEGCQRFVEVFMFAQSICCTDLADTCCELLDSQLFKKISEPDVISGFDFFTIKSITSSRKLAISEKDVFDLVVDWLKMNSGRFCNFGDILDCIQYQLIDSDYLSDVVFEFVLEQPNLPADAKKSILKKVKDSMRKVPEKNSRCTATESSSSPVSSRSVPKVTVSPENNECLRKVALVKGGKPVTISNEELISCVCNNILSMKKSHQDMLINYCCSQSNRFKYRDSKSLIDQFLPLHDVYPSLKLLWFVVERCTSEDQFLLILYEISWHLVSFRTILTIVTNSAILDHLLEFDCKREYKKKRDFNPSWHSIYSERFEGCGQVELIMLWSLANPNQKDKIKQLMDTICFLKIPQAYKKLILLPHIKVIFPDIKKLTCVHQHHDAVLDLLDMKVEIMPGNFYLSKPFTNQFSGEKLFYELKFSPSNSSSCLELKSHGNEKGYMDYDYCDSKSHRYILFDSDESHPPKYPLFVASLNPSIIQSIVKCFKTCCLMFYKRLDE